MLLLSLMIMAVVDGEYRPTFTPFNPQEAARSRAPGPNQPLPARSKALLHKQPYNFRNSFSSFFSGNIIEQVRAQADSTKNVLKSLANNKPAAHYIESIIESNICVDNLEDVIEAIERVVKLVEKNSNKILNLIAAVESLENITDHKLDRSHADILKILADPIPSFAQEPSKLCIASPGDTIEAFMGFATLVEDLSNAKDIQLSFKTRQQLKFSSKIISEVTNFLGKLNTSLASFDSLCGKDNDYNTAVINTIGDIMESLAALFDAFDDSTKAKELRKNGDFVKEIAVSFNN